MGNHEKNKCKLVTMFTMNFGYFLVELVVGYLTNSTALVADSFHMLSDVVALVVAFFAVKMSPKKWSRNTFGWARAEVLGALVNAVFLLALCFSIFVDSIQRFFETVELKEAEMLLIVGSIGLLMNIIGLFLFGDVGHGHSHDGGSAASQAARKSGLTHSNRLTRMVSNVDSGGVDNNNAKNSASVMPMECVDCPETASMQTAFVQVNLEESKSREKTIQETDTKEKSKKDKKKVEGADQMNMKGVFLHLLSDAMGSVVVVISALVFYFYPDWKYTVYIDPALSLFIVILIAASTCPLLIESSMILLQSVPGHIDMEELESKLLKDVDGIIGIHELHVWQLAGDRIIATAHIKCKTLQEYFTIAEKVKTVFHDEGIHSTTIQPEFPEQSPTMVSKVDEECYLSCTALSNKLDCSGNTCCPPTGATGVDQTKQQHHH